MPQKGGPLIDTKQFQRRVLAVVVLMALLLTGLGSVLYDLQINNGESYRRQSQYKIAETETVEAGRGQILDRNGRVLVSDKAVYQVKLNTSLMGKAPQRNDAILSLLQVARATGTEWEDTLPISRQQPLLRPHRQRGRHPVPHPHPPGQAVREDEVDSGPDKGPGARL